LFVHYNFGSNQTKITDALYENLDVDIISRYDWSYDKLLRLSIQAEDEEITEHTA
jgi:hypothetical protein